MTQLIEQAKAAERSVTLEELTEILGTTVRKDDINKVITFLTMLLTYTEEDQINIGFLAESATGKSYIPLELSYYFSKEDVLKLGYASPQTFFYESGILLPDPSDKRDVEDEKKRKIRSVDLHQKIVIFLDQPHDLLLQRLRSLLSHDEKKIVSKIVNKNQRSGNRTETVIIEGFPTVIFCTAKSSLSEQEKTRLLLLSPEINQEKLRETIALKIDRESDRDAYDKRLKDNPQRQFLEARVSDIKTANISQVKIPEDLREQLYRRFLGDHKNLIPRHQRDISRLLAIIKGYALLNFHNKEQIGTSIFANSEDVEAGFQLYSIVSVANELGLPPEIYDIFQKMKPWLENRENGITRKEFQQWYFNEYYKVIGRDRASEILKILDTTGLLVEQPDPVDRRFMRYVLPDSGVSEGLGEKNNVSLDSGYTLAKPQSAYPPLSNTLFSEKTGKANSLKEEDLR